MGKNEILSALLMELRRGTIVLCALDYLHKPMYGYHLVTAMEQGGVPVETNTLYPLLRRLEAQGLLESNWNTQEAKPRKYYVITPFGKEIYEALKNQWRTTTQKVNVILEESRDE